MSFNGGDYTGAILFAGFMYLGAAAFIWLVRTWKIGDLERKAAAMRTDARNVNPTTQDFGAENTSVPADVKITPFLRRMFVWRNV